jgi:hypothetical protein
MVGKSIIANQASSSSPHGRGPGWSSLDGSQGTWLEFDRVIIAKPGQQQQSPREATRCSSLDGSQGTWLEFDRVISADQASSSSPHGRGPGWSSLDGRQIDQRQPGHRCAHTKLFLPSMCTHQAFLAIDVHTPSFSCHRCAQTQASSSSPHGRRPGWSSLDGSQGTWLEFDRVISAKPGQQQSPREGTRCSSLDGRQIDHRQARPAAAVPTGGDSMQFPRWSANRSSPSQAMSPNIG